MHQNPSTEVRQNSRIKEHEKKTLKGTRIANHDSTHEEWRLLNRETTQNLNNDRTPHRKIIHLHDQLNKQGIAEAK